MSLRTGMLADMAYCILNNDEHAENIVYTPYGGTAKTIKAVAIRERLQTSPQDAGRAIHRQAEVYIANDATYGMATVKKGQDEIQMAVYDGGSPMVVWSVIDILANDAGAWRLLVQR